MSRTIAGFGVAIISLILILWWGLSHFHEAYQAEKTRADNAEQQVNAAQAITSNVLTTMTIFNTISEANQHAKEQIALDASGAAADIKVAVANDDCAPRDIPVSAVKRVQQYKNSLRQSASGAATGRPDS
ncbi:TPA: DUF2570 domain-containing protein [Klebsiella aerogenes]|uniref:DUF2570 family protein n=1 Tax=Klebsiella aerogenes TaxID=548 RepID=UPI00388F01C7|nr:DUF2570 domain-containing protein [Klebsiella aerogenes]HCM1703182.1 DUF2570 domain-containing protein [Klebsiella aerogenes]